MRNVPISCAVMAFSLGASAASGAETDEADKRTTLDYGETETCDETEFGSRLIPSSADGRLLAAYAESGNVTVWVRVLQQGQKFFFETELKSGMRGVKSSSPRRRAIEPELATRISTRLAADLSQNAFVQQSDEIQIDGIWFLYTADGKTCATVPWISRNARTDAWADVFSALYGNARGSAAQTQAWFWLDQIDQHPATLPTSLTMASDERGVSGAASTWNHPGQEPMAILNHHVSYDGETAEIVGELTNNLDTARSYAKVVATYYDASGKVLATDTDYAAFSLLPPGTRSPFDFFTKVQNAASYTLRIEPGDVKHARPASLRITNQQVRQDEDDLIIHGTVRNDGKSDEKDVDICVLLYDESGRLLDADDDDLDDTLKVGSTAPFEVSIERPPGYHHYEVIVNPEYRESRE